MSLIFFLSDVRLKGVRFLSPAAAAAQGAYICCQPHHTCDRNGVIMLKQALSRCFSFPFLILICNYDERSVRETHAVYPRALGCIIRCMSHITQAHVTVSWVHVVLSFSPIFRSRFQVSHSFPQGSGSGFICLFCQERSAPPCFIAGVLHPEAQPLALTAIPLKTPCHSSVPSRLALARCKSCAVSDAGGGKLLAEGLFVGVSRREGHVTITFALKRRQTSNGCCLYFCSCMYVLSRVVTIPERGAL